MENEIVAHHAGDGRRGRRSARGRPGERAARRRHRRAVPPASPPARPSAPPTPRGRARRASGAGRRRFRGAVQAGQPLVQALAGDAQAAGGGRLRPPGGDQGLEHPLRGLVEARLAPARRRARARATAAQRAELGRVPHRRAGGGGHQARALGRRPARRGAAHGSPPRASSPTAVTAPRRTRSRATAAMSWSPRTATTARRPSTSASMPIRSSRSSDPRPCTAQSVARDRSTPTDRARRTTSAALPARPSASRCSSRARSADGTSSDGGWAASATESRKAASSTASSSSSSPWRESTCSQQPGLTGRECRRVGRRWRCGRARPGTRRPGRPRASVAIGVRSMRSNSTCAPSTSPSAATRPARAEALAGGLAQLRLQRHRPPQRLQLARHEPLVHDVGDVDEAHVAARTRAAAGRARGRRATSTSAGAWVGSKPMPGGAGAGDGGDERLHLRRRHARRGRCRS